VVVVFMFAFIDISLFHIVIIILKDR